MTAEQHINDNDVAAILSRFSFMEEQTEQVQLGIMAGLVREQIEVYARPEFSASAMRVIRKALECLPLEQVRKLARPGLDWEQMRTLFYGLRAGWPMPLIEWIADSVIDRGEMTGHGIHFTCLVDTVGLLFDGGWIRTEEERGGDNLED